MRTPSAADTAAPPPRPRRAAADFSPEVLRLFDQYVHGLIDRRVFLERAGAGSAALMAALSPDFAGAQQVAPGDARLKTESMHFDSPRGHGRIRAYVARPAQAGAPLPVVLVVHENRGLNPHIEDVARRLALAGHLAVAPDALTSLGGYPGDEDKARAAFAQLEPAKASEDFVAAAGQARTLAGGNGRLGAVGFCYGGGIVNLLATRLGPDLRAGAAFYGGQPPAALVPAIRAEMLLVYAENDERINAGAAAYDAALKAAGTTYASHVYPGTQHGFHNDTTPRHDAAAAALAWQRTLALFGRTLRG